MPFSKWEAVGNDFVLVDAGAVPPCGDVALLAKRLCDRHRGVGADGMLFWSVSGRDRLVFRIFNADGSEDTMCGNGLRCVVSEAVSRGLVDGYGTAATGAGDVAWSVGVDGVVALTLPPPSFDAASIPTTAPGMVGVVVDGFELDLVQTGSPHAVAWVGVLPDDATFEPISRAIEHHAWFPERISVMWVVSDSDNRLRLRIWERGVGETPGCGTGACAAAVSAVRRGMVRPGNVTVQSPGGVLRIAWEGPGSELVLAGPARCVFRGDWPLFSV